MKLQEIPDVARMSPDRHQCFIESQDAQWRGSHARPHSNRESGKSEIETGVPTSAMRDSVMPTVFIVDDDEATRQSTHWLLKSVHLAASLHASPLDFLNHYAPGQPGCLLTELRTPDMSGLDLLDHLRAKNIDIPVIIMSAHGDVPTAVRALKNGALDFVQKPFNNQDMLDRIQSALRLDRENHAKHTESQDLHKRMARLTSREREVLEHIWSGKSTKLIARELDISYRTVEAHRTNVMRKLNVHHAVELFNIHSKYQHLEQETACGFRLGL